MKRKRNETTVGSNKIVCLQNGSNVEVQLDDGKWHSGIIVQCQPRKYLVQVDQQQYWIESDLIRPNTVLDQKRNVSFEYRPGQFLRNESKSSTNKILSDEKISSIPADNSNDLKKKRSNRTNINEQKKSPFVWKPSTISTIQTRRSSKVNQVSEENQLTISNSEKPSSDETPSEVLIFRPVIRFVESTTSNNNSTSPKRHCSIDDENLVNPDVLYHINASTDSRSSSTTSTENPYPIEQQIKTEPKSSCFLETPPPSLPDIHLTQESESTFDKPNQQFKSKRKQDRPQRKSIQQEFFQEKSSKDPMKPSTDLVETGYLSDEYGEPNPNNEQSLTDDDLEKYLHDLNENFERPSSTNGILSQQLFTFIHKNQTNFDRLEQYRLKTYENSRSTTNNTRFNFISKILDKIFHLFYEKTLEELSIDIPEEIQTHIKLCLNQINNSNLIRKKISNKTKRLQNLKLNKKRSSLSHSTNELHLISNDQQFLLSPASPLTPLSTKLSEQQSTEDLLSPNTNLTQTGGVLEQISVLPKERDIYEIINCLCHCQIDNGFMIQCETCFCWSHCECVGVTANCIPAFFKCSVCTAAEAERTPQWTFSSIFDDETTVLYLSNANNSEKVSLLLSYSKRLWNLREQMIELKLRSTPTLRYFQYALRCDDLTELYEYANIQSDRLTVQIEERKENREFYETVANTIDEIVDSVCSTGESSSCLSIELSNEKPLKSNRFNDEIDVLISHLCDDDQTRQVRSTIQNRYERFMSTIDKKIKAILLEHQNIQTQLAFEFGIIPMDLSDEYLSYDTYESALRTAIDRLKC